MEKGKKYDCRVIKTESDWSAQILRRVTSKNTIVSKRQDGFATEAEAKEWGETELKSFLKSQSKKNSDRNSERKKARFKPRK